MKNLRDQIEFIDKKLIVLYGFKDITDYSHSINITDVETIKIDLMKINELIPEFRNVFQAKNFNLHKTNYKIETETQAICLLRTSLEVTSIPFDISLKKNKRILRLISKNNILDDYINELKTKKMSDIRTLSENTKILDLTEASQSLGNKEEKAQIEDSTQILIKADKGYKQIEDITKDMLNEAIESTFQYNFSVQLNKEFLNTIQSNKSIVGVDISTYGISGKSVKNCIVSIKSKMVDNKPLISQEVLNEILSDLTYKIYIGYQEIYENKFVNNKDIIISDIIIIDKCLTYHKVILGLCNINKIMDYLDMLEIEFNITYVIFNLQMEAKLTTKNCIVQEIEHNNLFNNLRILHGMAGLSHTKYVSKDEFIMLDTSSSDPYSLTVIKSDKGYKQEEKSEIITKEMLNKSIKSTFHYNFSIELNKEFIKIFQLNEPEIRLDLSNYGISNQSIKNCIVSIKSKMVDDKPLVSQEVLNVILSEITYSIRAGWVIYEDKFVNNQDIILSNIILIGKCLTLPYKIYFELYDINKIIDYIDMLEIEFNMTCVNFYTEMENKLTIKNSIRQEIEQNGLFNHYEMYNGMAVLTCNRYRSKDENSKSHIRTSYFQTGSKSLDEEFEKSGGKSYKCISVPQLNGLEVEINNYDKKLFGIFGPYSCGSITKKYDYITWKNTFNIDIDFLPYHGFIENKNTFIHCYDIPLRGRQSTMREISIIFNDFAYKTLCIGTMDKEPKKFDIQVEFIDFYKHKIINGPINNCKYYTFTEEQSTINQIFNSEDQHIYTSPTDGLRLKIRSSSSEPPIKNNVIFIARCYSWNSNVSYLGKDGKEFEVWRNPDYVYPNIIKKE